MDHIGDNPVSVERRTSNSRESRREPLQQEEQSASNLKNCPILASNPDWKATVGHNVGFICQELYIEILLGFCCPDEFSFSFNMQTTLGSLSELVLHLL